MCAIKRSYPKVGVGQILKQCVEYNVLQQIQRLFKNSNMGLTDKV